MSWKSVKHPKSLSRRLTYLHLFSTFGLLLVIVLIFSPKLAFMLSTLNDSTHANFTVECIKTILLMLLFISVGAMIVGQILAKKGLIQLEQFSMDIAHELRHPLQHVMQMTELSLSKTRIEPDVQALLVSYMDEFQKISTLVEQLLFIARSQHGQIPLNKTKLQLESLVESLFEYYQAWAEEKNMTLSCSGQGVLMADAVLLQRMFCNLFANALQYTPAGGSICVNLSTLPRRKQVRIDVQDNGIGIEAKHLPYLFHRCYQVDPSRSKPTTLGLGLSMVKSIVSLHQGQVSIESTPQLGTTVSIILPL